MRDRSKAGRSNIVPYKPGEDSSDRHWRRLSVNLEHEEEIRLQAGARGLKLQIANDGQHWMFARPGLIAEWWPSSAKLVFNKQWRRGVHCHDWQQVFREIDRRVEA